MGNADSSQPAASGAGTKYKWVDIQKHNTKTDAWIVIKKKVYNVTKFLSEHPGGGDILLEHAGKDATEDHLNVGHSQDAVDLMNDFLIGVVEE